MDRTHLDPVATAPLLHPRLSGLDPSVASAAGGPRARGDRPSRSGRLAGTLVACLTVAFAAHAIGPASAPVARQPARAATRGAVQLSWIDAGMPA